MEKKLFKMSSFSTKILIEAIGFFEETLSLFSSLASDPLFSIFVALYSLILLYFPRIFLDLVFSPVLISTAVLLSTLLRLGAIQRNEQGNTNSTSTVEKENTVSTEPDEIDSTVEDDNWVACETNVEPETGLSFVPYPVFSTSFVEWNLKAPLEVIYEEYEGEKEDDSNEKQETPRVGIERMLSLSLCFPETDTDSSSDGEFPEIEGWDSPENMCFRWDEEDREELIEIPLDGKRSPSFHFEEDNLIEIDISPFGAPNDNSDFFPASVRFS
ncbi:PREDICTED: uncharacterized protein LOC104605685 [Nelumbo nucifera]|uniref:Uncharacterized protein LOC104605685 n=1 Tax=Nelumbo nucifera TaxID=4432 RepID=A0A1U8AR80_NELNU|nr:PREDICTED: uncharacterized protein LOC104605685 [Nelumbo nucifera]